ncbi:MAG: response regulator [Rhodospirillales bacterium]|nr:response regulator [Rhodospirillales bacterium]
MNSANRVLVVDDDVNLLNGLRRFFGKRFDLSVAQGGDEALEKIKGDGPYSVVLCDMRMPGLSGVEVLEQVQGLAPDTVRLMLTGNADQKTAIDAINRGKVYKFFNKPCSPGDLAAGIEEALAVYHRARVERELLETTLTGSVRMLTDLLALIDPVSYESAARLSRWVAPIARRLGVTDAWQLEVAASLAPLGMSSIPPEVLARKRAGEKLTLTEEEMVVRAPEVGGNILRNIPRLEPIADIIHYQDKDFDGAGFPRDGKAGEDLPLGARILHVLKAVDELAGAAPTAVHFDSLARNAQRYDPTILETARLCLASTGPASAEAKPTVVLEVPVSAMRAGDELLTNLELANGHLILATGSPLSLALLSRIHNLQKIHAFNEPVRIRRQAVA